MMSKTENRIPNAKCLFQSAIGFTLVELLVVISIIVLLVAILLPTLSRARKEAANIFTNVRITDLSNGCIIYHKTHDYYPGQQYASELKGSTGGTFTGSQWLARSLFTDPDATPVYPNSKYAPVRAAEDLINPVTSGYHTISDCNKTTRNVLPILYYPARSGESGLSQYKEGDNSDYTTGHTGTGSKSFSDFIKNERFGQSDTPYNPGAYLLIAAGMDRLYFTNDDLCHPAFGGD